MTLWFQAQQEVLTLQRANHRLRSMKICLKQQRDAYVRQIAKRSGEEDHEVRFNESLSVRLQGWKQTWAPLCSNTKPDSSGLEVEPWNLCSSEGQCLQISRRVL